MKLTFEQVRMENQRLEQRCYTARVAGGVALENVYNGLQAVPDGWIYDIWSRYYVPANLFLDETSALQ